LTVGDGDAIPGNADPQIGMAAYREIVSIHISRLPGSCAYPALQSQIPSLDIHIMVFPVLNDDAFLDRKALELSASPYLNK
jgi:hypothetical protein